MGGGKLLLPFGDTTVAGAALRALLHSPVGEAVVVLGHEAEKVRQHLWSVVSGQWSVECVSCALATGHRPLKFVVNTNYKEGMFSSLLCGLEAANPGVQAFLVSLADMPGVTGEVIDTLLAEFRDVAQGPSNKKTGPSSSWTDFSPAPADLKVCATTSSPVGIVLPTYMGRRGHPVLFHRRYLGEIRGLDPQIGLRGLLSPHPDEILEVPVDCPGVVRDIDFWEDYVGLSSNDASSPRDG